MNTASEHPSSDGPKKGPEPKLNQEPPSGFMHRKTTVIAALSISAILVHLALRFCFHTTSRT